MIWRGLIFIISGIIRIGDIVTNILYLATTKFYNKNIYILVIVANIAPTSLILLFMILMALLEQRNLRDCCNHIFFGFFFTVLSPSGISKLIFGWILLFQTESETDFKNKKKNIEFLSKSYDVVACLFDSLPQVALQAYNNTMMNT